MSNYSETCASLKMSTKYVENRPDTLKRGKHFLKRNSLLIDLFENIHIRTVYRLFIVIFLTLVINTAVHEYLHTGKLNLGLGLIKVGFAKVHVSLFAWTGIFALTCLTYVLFNVWANNRHLITSKHVKVWDKFWLLLLFGYYILSLIVTTSIIKRFALPPASSAIILGEQARLLMKTHSFVRSNILKITNRDPNAELILPKFTMFAYFLFVPTLIYKDTYPRTTHIDWSFVCWRLVEVIAAIFFVSFLMERLINPSIQDFGIREYTLKEVILTSFENSTGGVLTLLTLFFLILHSWQNMFAELTRFGDRMFYQDWWNLMGISDYFRKWNVIVQDWLYAYVYLEFTNPAMGQLAVLFLSTAIHEWILFCMFGFFMPLLSIEFFVFGLVLMRLQLPRNDVSNVLCWYSLALGMGTLMTFYGFEYYARRNIPGCEVTFMKTFLPRFVTCGRIAW